MKGNRNIIRLLIAAILMLPMMLSAAVYTPSTVPNPKNQGQQCYVSNPDAIIADSDVVFLNRCAASLERQTDVEMAVVALGSIGDADAFDFAYELFQRWGIGGEGKNTGVLILFAEESHDIRIMTGVGIEGVLPDAKCSRIIQENMIPAFREGDYGGGLCLGALRIYETCTDGEAPEELRNARSVTNRGQYASDDGQMDDAEFWIILIALIVFIAVLIWASRNKGGRSGGRSSGGGTVIFTPGGFGGGGFSGGGFSGGSWGGGSTMGGGSGGKW